MLESWLKQTGLEQYGKLFADQEVDFEVLRTLTEDDLRELGLPLGARKKLLLALARLGEQSPDNPREDGLPSASAERRQLTIMFCDLVGSTALSQQLDPEALRELMQRYQQACRGVIEKYEGHVAQYLGDGLMVYFGFPRAHEDDAERAVRSALEIVEAVKKVPAPSPLGVRVGIATGPVVVGETGSGDASVPKLAVGETPNMAARLQGLAGPDEIVIALSTHRLLGSTFEFVDLGEQSLKGIVSPVRAYRVAGVGQAEGRFEAMRAGQLTPFTGREEEIALLARRWELAREGDGQVVLLCGEPGIGKSRITQALRAGIAGEPHTRLGYQCSPFHTHSAFYPVIEHLERAAGFLRQDPPDTKLAKLEARLRQAGPLSETAVPLFASLLSLGTGERFAPLQYSPQRQKEETISALCEQITGLAMQQPVLVVFEDAHWIDPSTLETLDLLVQRIRGKRVLVLIAFRPEFQARWTLQSHVTLLTLNRLARKHAALMVDRITSGKPLPAEVLDQIVAKTDGVPLFVEELTKAVLESGLLTEVDGRYRLKGTLADLAIPSTLQDSLMARLDRLASVKEIAQIGACIGRDFSFELMVAVSPLDERQLAQALGKLEDSGLVHRSGQPPNATYTFKHALVQDVAYQSILKTARMRLHEKIATILLEHYPVLADTEPEIIAHHYTAANNHDQYDTVVGWNFGRCARRL